MAKQVMSVKDPLGTTVFLLEGTCIHEEQHHTTDIYDTAITVIQKPALMIRVDNNNEIEYYYFRSVGWHSTMLITTHLENERWETYKCVRNPSNEELSALLKKGKQLI